ncbi:MAG: hypothetical protein ACREX5_00070, partial [Achromobacter pestifer]
NLRCSPFCDAVHRRIALRGKHRIGMHRDAAARGDGVPDGATQLALERNYRIQIAENIMLNPAASPQTHAFRNVICNATRDAISANHSKPGITNDFS